MLKMKKEKILYKIEILINKYYYIKNDTERKSNYIMNISDLCNKLKNYDLTKKEKNHLQIVIKFLNNERNKLNDMEKFWIDLNNFVNQEIEINTTIQQLSSQEFVNKYDFKYLMEQLN